MTEKNTVPVLGEAKEAIDLDAVQDVRIANRLASAQVDATSEWTQWYSSDIQALKYRLRMAEERCETWKRQCGNDQEKIRQLYGVLDSIVAERDGLFDRVWKLAEMGEDEDRGLTSDSVCDAAWAKALKKALSPQGEDDEAEDA